MTMIRILCIQVTTIMIPLYLEATTLMMT